ncbi:MAG: DUF3786 domain-containing protein [Candidatus Thorarchaeota archaeon]|nr:DUF3786 domain-containing protein [Candidatus Thorarchaeota archaeon]
MVDEIIEYWASLARELASRFNIHDDFDMSSEFWNWDNFSEEIRGLKNNYGIGNDYVDILGLRVDFETGETLDTLTNTKTNTSRVIPHLYYHTKSQDMGVANEWVKFNALSGSWACRYSFDEKDVNALTDAYVDNREKLFEALKRFGAKEADFGDASFEVSFLPMIKVLLVFEDADEEFPASVRLLYDKNSIYYMPHEQLGDISWFLASRVMKAM